MGYLPGVSKKYISLKSNHLVAGEDKSVKLALFVRQDFTMNVSQRKAIAVCLAIYLHCYKLKIKKDQTLWLPVVPLFGLVKLITISYLLLQLGNSNSNLYTFSWTPGICQNLSLGADNQKQMKFWKLKILLLFNGSSNTLQLTHKVS